MTTPEESAVGAIGAFAFEAQGSTGEPVSGTINASSVAEAQRKLGQMHTRVIALDPVRAAPRPRRLSGDDFQTFNTQLAYLTSAGMPVEKSLRLIADDMHSGRLAESVRQVATDLESGGSLPEAFERHSAQFPPLYSQLVNAGVRTGDLAAMLLGLGRHLDLIQRLRNLLWKAAAYPVAVLFSLALVVGFLGICVLPQFKMIFADFKVELPTITQLVIGISNLLVDDWPIILAVLLVVIFGLPLMFRLIWPAEFRQKIVETLIFPLPLIGTALRRNLLARWCDALRLAVESGLDLPASITLAGQAVGSPGLMRDGEILVAALQAGLPIDAGISAPISAGVSSGSSVDYATPNLRLAGESISTRLLPRTVTTVIALATTNNDLPSGLRTLSTMFQQQAERKMAMIPALLTPILIALVAVVIGFVVIAMFAPMIALIQAVSGPVIK